MQRKKLAAVALAATVGTVAVGTAIATPGTGIIGGAPILARGTLEAEHNHRGHHGHHGSRRDTIRLQRPSDVAVQQVTIAPGGATGWHSHPGPAVVIVKSGSLTLYDADDRKCRPTTYDADDPENPGSKVFIDEGYGHVHIGRNEGTTNTELYVTYLDVPVGALPRIDVPDPGNRNCRF